MSGLKAELQAKCEAAGINYDKRWGVESLEEALAAASGHTEPEVAQEAAVQAAEAVPAGMVRVRVTKWGDGKISDGEGGNFARDDELTVPVATADSLESKYYAEAYD